MPPIWIVALVALALVGLVFTLSSFIPRNHAVSVRARYARPSTEVWAVIMDVAALPTWRTGVKSVQRRADVLGKPAWVEHSRRGPLPLEVIEWEAPSKMVARIADDAEKLPFGGTWTWHLREVPSGCELTLTENGFIKNALFRVLAHYVFGYTRTLQTYLRDLGTRFGETVTPKVV